jgi:hypothetical protein
MSDTNRIKELEAELKAAQDTILDQRVEITALRKTKPGSNRGKIVPGTFTAELESAVSYASKAVKRWGGDPVVYQVSPIGPIKQISAKPGASVLFASSATIDGIVDIGEGHGDQEQGADAYPGVLDDGSTGSGSDFDEGGRDE